MRQWNDMKTKWKKISENASCESNLRFCAENREYIYSWLWQSEDKDILLVTEENLVKAFEEIEKGRKFDFIILDDVLWQLEKIEKTIDVHGFIEICGRSLNPKGKLVIATANRFGAKYLAGAADPQTGRYYDGVGGYPGEKEKKSYTKGELTELLATSGMKEITFFYPYPDQRYVKEIFAADSLEQYSYGKPCMNFEDNRFELFDTSCFLRTLVKEGNAECVANAFLVVACPEESDEMDDVSYVKLNWDRAPKFQIGTILKKNKSVIKYPMSESAKQHICDMFDHQDAEVAQGICNLKGERNQESLVYPFLKYDNLDTLIVREIEKGDKDNVIKLFRTFYEKLFDGAKITKKYYTEEFCEVFGEENPDKEYHCAAPMNIDLICDNVFCTDDGYTIIDGEWIFPFLIPVEFVIWRSINELYSKHSGLEAVISRDEFNALFSIEKEDETVFWEWGSHFAYEYVESDTVRKQACETAQLSMEWALGAYPKRELPSCMNAAMLNGKMESDRGDGFDSRGILNAEIWVNKNCFRLHLDLPGHGEYRLLKWTPIEGRPYHICINKMSGAEVVGHNAYKKKAKKYSFLLGDSFLYLLPDKDISGIDIEGELFCMDASEQRAYVKSLQQKEEEKTVAIHELEAELENIRVEKERLQNDLDSVVNSTIWRKTEPLRRLKDRPKKEEKTTALEIKEEEIVSGERSVEERIRYCIDDVILSDGMMSVDGWILCEDGEIDMSYLVLTDVFGIRRQYPFQLDGRKDVAMALNIRFEGGCGIHVAANYKSFCAQKISLKVLAEGEWHEFDTGVEIPPSKDAAEGDFYLERYSEADDFIDYYEFKKQNTGVKEPDVSQWKVDVIVPVYNGMKYLPRLFSGMEKTKVDYRLILIEDCSPDTEVLPYLREYASGRSNVVLLENSENLGFVKSVNRALRMTEHHVALVNTDVELPENWLERLMRPIFENPEVASVTPFTNSATIFSFPDFDKDNKLFMGMSVNEIDKAFRNIVPPYTEVPTGVGFCMGMSINAIREVGILDEETFEKGYGEENDWCQRAIDAGYKNVYAENIFVHHDHGGSFPSETKKRLMRENAAKLIQKHPDYNADVARFARKDPNRPIREYAKFELMFHYDAPFVLAFDHDLGGGASAYLKQKMAEQLKQGKIFGIIRYNMVSDKYFLELYYGDYEARAVIRNRKNLLKILKERSYEAIWINELATYTDVVQWLLDIKKLRVENAKELRLLLHDYFMVCPSLNLMDLDAKYCKLPEDAGVCDNCLTQNEFTYCSECGSIVEWRTSWEDLMKACDDIIAFSQDTINIMKKVYPNISSIRLIPHYVEPLEKVERKGKLTSTYNIGVLGAISEQKGIKVIKKMLKYMEEKHPDMRIIIIGESSEEITSDAFSITGRYVRKDIPKLTKENDIDVFLIPSVWPETFSYTTSEIMSMDMPIAVFNLGAPVERVKDYEKGLILGEPDMDTAELVEKLYTFAREQVQDMDS